MSTPNTIDRPTLHDEVVTYIEPPRVPFGFLVRSEPAPLFTAKDVRWVVRAIDEECGNAEGILIYEEDRVVAFLNADEVAAYLFYLSKEGWNLISECTPALSEAHTQGVELLRSMWWMQETRKARALLGIGEPIRQDQERARLLDTLATLQSELAQVQSELARTWARVRASHRHTFTLTFAGGQVALLEVRGAANQEEARTIACTAITRCQYTVTDGDQTGGRAHIFYYCCSIQAQTTTR